MYTAISLFASLEETYESQLNKHLCSEPREGRVGVSLGDQSGLQSPEMDLPPAQGLENITSGGSHVDQGLSLGHELGVSQGHYSNAQSLLFCFRWCSVPSLQEAQCQHSHPVSAWLQMSPSILHGLFYSTVQPLAAVL